jgi:CheY-like chemotaxis protein
VTLDLRRAGLDDLLAAVHDALTPELDRRCTFAPSGAATQVLADRAQTARVIGALVQHAEALALPDTPLMLQASAAQAELSVQFLPDQRLLPSGGWFGSWRSRSPGALPLRTARQLMQLQQGELRVRVSETRGEFAVQLRADDGRAEPLSDAGADSDRSARPAPPAAPTRVMIVDDSSEVRKAYREALVALGYTVSEAVNAEEALGAIQNDLPQVALIDIHLPQMNGYRLAQTIKARVGSQVRLIMLSGMTMDEVTRRLSRQAGFDDCLDKMAGPAALHRLLQSGGST